MKRRWLVPTLVAVVVFGPFVLATLLYYGPWTLDWLPQLAGQRQLLDPPVPLPASWRDHPPDERADRWSVIYAKMTACDDVCLQQLMRLRQVQGALGRDASRVRRVCLCGGPPPATSDAGLERLRLQAEPDFAAAVELDRWPQGRVYVADPRGEVIASYPPDVAQRELLRDIKRLLAASGTN